MLPRLWSDIVPDPPAWPIGMAVWGDTALVLPRNGAAWRNVLTGAAVAAAPAGDGHRLLLGDALATFPVGVFEAQ